MQNRLGLRPVPSANGKRKTNPTADKIMDICNVLQITPEQLLTGKGIEDEENITVTSRESCFMPYDIQLVQDYHGLKEEQREASDGLYGGFKEDTKS